MEKLGTQKSEKKTDSKDYLTEYETIEETPFTLVGNDEKCQLAMGKYLLTNQMSKEEAREDAKRTDWARILQIMTIVAEDTITNHKN